MGNETGGMTVKLSPKVTAELQGLEERYGYGPVEILTHGTGMMKLLLRETDKGNKIQVTTLEDEPLTELVLPEPQAMKSMVQKILGERTGTAEIPPIIESALTQTQEEVHSPSLERAIADLDPDNEHNGKPERGGSSGHSR